ncbi:MAG: hypothetical protein IBX55_00310 [Methyloprofundus sp.]|nr:hypothetical protein [Methyloprofundus sp.]
MGDRSLAPSSSGIDLSPGQIYFLTGCMRTFQSSSFHTFSESILESNKVKPTPISGFFHRFYTLISLNTGFTSVRSVFNSVSESIERLLKKAILNSQLGCFSFSMKNTFKELDSLSSVSFDYKKLDSDDRFLVESSYRLIEFLSIARTLRDIKSKDNSLTKGYRRFIRDIFYIYEGDMEHGSGLVELLVEGRRKLALTGGSLVMGVRHIDGFSVSVSATTSGFLKGFNESDDYYKIDREDYREIKIDFDQKLLNAPVCS